MGQSAANKTTAGNGHLIKGLNVAFVFAIIYELH